MHTSEIVTNKDLEAVFENTNFGVFSKRLLLKESLLKVACGFEVGKTIRMIMAELDLISYSQYATGKRKYNIKEKGKKYLWASFYSIEDVPLIESAVCDAVDKHQLLPVNRSIQMFLDIEKAITKTGPEHKLFAKRSDGCKNCINNKPGEQAGLFCINNCIDGSKYEENCQTSLEK